MSSYLKRSQRDIYYSTIIKTIMLYGRLIWTSCSKEKLFFWKSCVFNAKRTTPSVGLFNSLERIPFHAESYLNRCTLTYRRLNGNTPKYINDLLIRNSDTPHRSTRFCNLKLSCPRYKRSKEGGRTFAVRATKEWNKLSVDLKRSTSVKNFKRSFFKIILNQILTQLFV